MAVEQDPITVLSDDEIWDLLKSAALGRLVTHIGDQLEIFPVNFVTQGRTVLFRTAEGTKLFGTVMNDKVLFEVDDHNVSEGWSVVIRGTARVLTASDEIHEAEGAQLLPWVATEKLRFVRITPTEMSGRRFSSGRNPSTGRTPARTAQVRCAARRRCRSVRAHAEPSERAGRPWFVVGSASSSRSRWRFHCRFG